MAAKLSYFFFRIIFAQILPLMTTNVERESVSKYWVIFIISLIVQIVFLIWIREYFWVVLPFVLTSFCKAIRII